MASTKITLFKSKTYNNGEHPIMLRFTHQRKSKYISLGYTASPNQWNKDKSRFKKNYPNYRGKNAVLRSLEERAESIIDEFTKANKPITFLAFEEEFVHQASSCGVYEFFDTRFEEEEKISTKDTYKNTKNALYKFAPNDNLMFEDIDYEFLKKFESHLVSQGVSGGGIHFYMRTLRALINEAISRNYLKRELYPFANQFNKNGYSLNHLKSKASPRALSIEDMDKIKAFDYKKHSEFLPAGYYFLFSYYARGINFTDMANLKWTDIYNGRIQYTRSKTGGNFSIKISQHLKKILNYFKKHYSESDYIFPVLGDFHQTPTQKKNRIRKCLKQYNNTLKELAKVLEINIPLTSYVARHTYATTLKLKGIDTAVISEGLGHQDISTTKAYLKQFDTETIDKADDIL